MSDANHDSIDRKRKGGESASPTNPKKGRAGKRKSDSATADPEDCENTYGIDHLEIGEAKHDLDDSKLLLAQHSIGQMSNNINNNKSLTHEFNVKYNILNPMKRTK